MGESGEMVGEMKSSCLACVLPLFALESSSSCPLLFVWEELDWNLMMMKKMFPYSSIGALVLSLLVISERD